MSKKPHGTKAKRQARKLYQEGYAVNLIAAITVVPKSTIYAWARAENWPNQYCDNCNTPYRSNTGITKIGEEFDLYFCSTSCVEAWEKGCDEKIKSTPGT